MGFERTDYDPVIRDEARHDRECETAREVRDAQIDEALGPIMDRITWGERDRDMANYFDSTVLMRIARTFATVDLELAFSRCGGDLLEIRRGIKEYARDLAEMRVD